MGFLVKSLCLGVFFGPENRRESSGGMEWLGLLERCAAVRPLRRVLASKICKYRDPFDHSEGQFSLNAKKTEETLEIGSRGLPAPGAKKPRNNKWCCLNGVFQSGVLRGWSGPMGPEGTKMLEKDWCFQAFFVQGFTSVGSRGEESEKHRLENTVWNP